MPRPCQSRHSSAIRTRHFVVTFCSQFQKKGLTDFQTHLKILIRSPLKSTDHAASNGGSNFEIRHSGAALVSFEVARLPEKGEDCLVRTQKWAKMRMKTENSKLSRKVGESSGQTSPLSKGLRAKCDHKVSKRGLSMDRTLEFL